MQHLKDFKIFSDSCQSSPVLILPLSFTALLGCGEINRQALGDRKPIMIQTQILEGASASLTIISHGAPIWGTSFPSFLHSKIHAHHFMLRARMQVGAHTGTHGLTVMTSNNMQSHVFARKDCQSTHGISCCTTAIRT